MKGLLVKLLSLFLATSVAIAAAEENYSKLILGTWLGPRKFRIFHADGTWGVQRNEAEPEERAGRRWSIKGHELTLSYPGDKGVETGIFAITELTKDRLVLEVDGHRDEYRRAVNETK